MTESEEPAADTVTGVTTDELEATAERLNRFASACVDEYGHVDEWISVSYRAIQILLDDGKPRSTVPLERQKFEANQTMNATDCAKDSCTEDSTTTIRYPSTGELRSYCDRHIRELLEMQVPFEGTEE